MSKDLFQAVEIEINHRCNLSCSYCPNSVDERIEKGVMELELYERLMLQLKQINYQGRISYDFYNEPLLHPQIFDIVQLTKKYLPHCRLEIYTNGTTLTYLNFLKFLDFGVDKFIVTKHEQVSKLPLDDYISQLPEKNKKALSYRSFQDLRLTNRGGVLPHIQHQFTTSLLPCYIPSTIVTVTVKGNVLPCFEDFYQEHIMGNINQSGLLEIWESPKYQQFRQHLRQAQRHRFSPCQNCNRLNTVPLDNP